VLNVRAHAVQLVYIDIASLITRKLCRRSRPCQPHRDAADNLASYLRPLAAQHPVFKIRRLVQQRHQPRLKLISYEVFTRADIQLRARPCLQTPAHKIELRICFPHLTRADHNDSLILRAFYRIAKRNDIRRIIRIAWPGSRGRFRVLPAFLRPLRRAHPRDRPQ
jgi:hypothetical protein